MKNQSIAGGIVIVIVAIVGSFYGGMQYGARNVQAKFAADQQSRGGFGGAGQRMGGQDGGQRGGMRGAGANGGAGDFSGGEITAKDDTSVTVKTRNGSSQIIFLSPSTTIDKSVSGDNSDLNIGQQITANGKGNPDGTLAAQSIQIRPSQIAK